MTSLAVLSDAPVSGPDDRLRFDRYVDPLVSLLTNPDSHTPFTVGVLGAWGSGKSSVLTMVDERLATEAPDAFLRVHFNPWVHRGEPNMLIPLLHAFRDTILADRRKRFAETALRVTSMIGSLTADLLLSTVTLGQVSIERFDAAKERYVRERGQVASELRTLRDTLRDELAALKGQGVQAVFFIDDIDRCEPDQIIDLLESVKLFLDVPGVFVLMAISKELVDRGISVKYQGLGFDQDGLVDLGDEYLEKMIQLPLYLLPLDSRSVRDLLATCAPAELLDAHGTLLESCLLPNPRKIKRVLNFLAVTNSILAGNADLAELDADLVARLAILRVQAPRLFLAVVREPRVLVVLEQLYGDRLAFAEDAMVNRFGPDDGRLLYRAVAPHHQRVPQLRPLFATSRFEAEAARLGDYLSLFGGPRAEA
ncbi:P-loop NTPase fold protein [Micromonospora sp. WMMD1102]|uniref:KAP family P-loop NTPase fold protein n=1 Tax=Micromonospora sp. WMMD1102 TaxID=3016105 RepID=UPI002414FEEB|nr:P-loop NTPase fold protein [Micromonospora sp. WMMD1102]MDG4788017.1 P-loop NTPase fold protein [Micromonospora sp. WMMD1102]